MNRDALIIESGERGSVEPSADVTNFGHDVPALNGPMTGRRAGFLLTSAIAWILVSGAALGESRMALVIGNSSYRSVATLKNPANDAAAVSGVLTNAGFEVISVTDLTQGDMRRAIRDFAQKVGEKGADTIALVFYAGHGLQVDGENFLVPIDARIERESDVAIETMRLADVMNSLASAPSKIRIVMLDACRNNPFEALKAGGKGLAIVDAPAGTIVAYSTAPGSEAQDGAGRNSPYTAAFLKAVKQPEMQIEQLFKRVRVLVNDVTDGKQIPWETSSLTSDFWFFPVSAAPAKKFDLPPAASSQPAPARPAASVLPAPPAPPAAPAQPVPERPVAATPPVPERPAGTGQPSPAERPAEVVQTPPAPVASLPTAEDLAKIRELRLEARKSEVRSRPVTDAYELVIEEDDVVLYEEFLAVHPNHPLAERVRRVLSRRQEAVAWRAATVTNTPEAYGDYLSRFSGGDYAIAAGRLKVRPRLRPIDPIFIPRFAPRVVSRPIAPPVVRPSAPAPVVRPPVVTAPPKVLPKATTLPKELPKATTVPKVLPKVVTPQSTPVVVPKAAPVITPKAAPVVVPKTAPVFTPKTVQTPVPRPSFTPQRTSPRILSSPRAGGGSGGGGRGGGGGGGGRR
jgi:hypothetical protein